MTIPGFRLALAVAALACGFALLVAVGSEWWGGLVPCALCLVERWPYRVAAVMALLGLALPLRLARLALAGVVLASLAGAVVAGVHVGVEAGWWASPLPQCQAPRFSGGSLAQRLAQMPAHPSKACEDPTYLIPSLPVSMAQMNLLFALALAGGLATWGWRSRRSEP